MLGGIALMDSEAGLLAETRLNVKSTHSERLMISIDHTLGQAGLATGDLGALVAATGPGSFTGLRIALSTVKGLSFATGVPVIGVPTLEAYAWSLPHCRWPVCPMLDARKKEVYAGVFNLTDDSTMERLLPEAPVRPKRLAEQLRNYERIMLMGQGADLYRSEFAKALGKSAMFAPPHLMVPSPSALAYAGLQKALKGEFEDPATLAPLYIRKSEAELNWPKK